MRLHRHERLDEGLTRIAGEAVDRAVEHLTDAAMNTVPRVHETRKRCKEIRAVLRLGRYGLEGDFGVLNAAFRGVARELASSRENDALLVIVNALRPATRDPLEWRALTHVSGILAAQPAGEEIDFAGLAKRLPSVSFDADGAGWFKRGLRRTYRNGRRAFFEARDAPNAASIHEWRKRVKDLWYVTEIIAPAWPEMMDPRVEMLHDLSRLLGDHHDIWALDTHVAENGNRFGKVTTLRIAAVAGRRLAEIEGEIFEKGATAYADRPRDWSQSIVDAWRAWTKAA
jgi:CHAD domain-containing protein